MPLFEPHLEDVMPAVRKNGRLHFGSTEEAIDWGDAIFICVGTPPLPMATRICRRSKALRGRLPSARPGIV